MVLNYPCIIEGEARAIIGSEQNESSDRRIDSYFSYGKLNSYTKILGGIGIHEQSLGDYLSSTTA